MFLKWGILNVPFCSMFVPFHFYLIMTLVVPCLDNIFMVLLISALATIGAMKPFFSDYGSSRGEGGSCMCGLVCYHCIVHILNSSKNSIFFVSNSDLCRAMLPNYLRTYSSALCQIRALEKAFKKQNNGQSVPKILVLNACIWLAKVHSNLHAILYVFCLLQWLVQCCADKPTWGHIPQLFATFEPWWRHLRRVTSAKGSKNLSFRCLHLIG